MIITLTGSNSFALRRRLNGLTAEFIKKYGDLAVERYDGEEDETGVIIEGLQSLPFLAKKKLVIVRNGNLNKDFAELIEQIISSIGESTDVVFYEPQIDRRSSYFKVLKVKTQFEDFGELDPTGLAKWLINEAKKGGGELSLADANYLVERIGPNQMMLASELNKLLIYDKQTNRQNIDLLTEPTPQSKVFDLLDSAFGGHKERALKLYDDQRAQKVEPAAILAMIAWQLQQIAIAKMAENRSLTEVAKDSGFKEYPLRKAKALASGLSQQDLQKMVSEALDIDLRSKTTALDLDEALKTYIVSL